MVLYYSIFVLISITLFFNDKITQYALTILWLFVFYFLSVTRWECGTDWYSYKDIFDVVLESRHSKEPLFYYLNYIVRSLSDNYSLLLFVEGTLIFLCIKKPILYFSEYPLLSILAFFCLQRGYIFFIRQTIAVSFCLLSAYYIYKEKLKTAFLFWITAICFHYLAIAFIGMFFLKRCYFSNRNCILLLVVFYCCSFLMTKIISLMNGSSFFLFYKLIRYANDSENMFGYGGGLSRMFLLLRSSFNRLLILLSLMFIRKNNKKDAMLNFVLNCNLTSTCLYFLFAPIAFTLARMTSVYAIMEIFVYPYYLRFAKTKNNKIIIMLIIIVYLLMRLYSGLFSNMEAFVPYRAIYTK